MEKMNKFTSDVMNWIRKIPEGKVATYSQIARLAGKPQGARGVAWILHSCATSYKLPWQRVINTQGRISFEKGTHNYRKQKKLLQSEGVEFGEGDQVRMVDFQWKKDRKPGAKSSARQPKMFR